MLEEKINKIKDAKERVRVMEQRCSEAKLTLDICLTEKDNALKILTELEMEYGNQDGR